jgi:hypothetical protein
MKKLSHTEAIALIYSFARSILLATPLRWRVLGSAIISGEDSSVRRLLPFSASRPRGSPGTTRTSRLRRLTATEWEGRTLPGGFPRISERPSKLHLRGALIAGRFSPCREDPLIIATGGLGFESAAAVCTPRMNRRFECGLTLLRPVLTV